MGCFPCTLLIYCKCILFVVHYPSSSFSLSDDEARYVPYSDIAIDTSFAEASKSSKNATRVISIVSKSSSRLALQAMYIPSRPSIQQKQTPGKSLKSARETRNQSPTHSPPPQNNPRAQNLQNKHQTNHARPPTRPRLNNQRSPAPRIRRRGQIVPLGDERRAETALLHDRRRRVVACAAHHGAAAVVVPVVGFLGWGGRGRGFVVRAGLVGVAVGEGAGAFVAVFGGAAPDLLVRGVLAG